MLLSSLLADECPVILVSVHVLGKLVSCKHGEGGHGDGGVWLVCECEVYTDPTGRQTGNPLLWLLQHACSVHPSDLLHE